MTFVLSDILKDKRTVAIGGHVHPDGDCTGACLGLYMYLLKEYPDLKVDVYLEEIPQAYHLIEKTEDVKHQITAGKQYDLFICLDCGDESRLGFSTPLYKDAKHTACIDHHVSNIAFADENYIVPDASSTSELIYTLLDKDRITRPIAEALYMGIVHDTGVFQYSCTSPETMEAGADLLKKGIDGSKIIDRTYYEKTYVQNQLLGKALLESFMLLDKQCIVAVLEKKDLDFFEAESSDTEGIVSQLRLTKGVEVALFMYELDTHLFKVSLRSKEKVDVSVIAKFFGGGGHARAAGATITGTKYDVINQVIEQISFQLGKESNKL